MFVINTVICVLMYTIPITSFQCALPAQQLSSPKLPPLPNQYESRVEVNIKQKGKTIEVTEFYDYMSNRAAINMLSNGQLYTSIINFEQMERYDIHPDGSCKTTDIKKHHRSVFGFTVGNGSSHVDTVTDVFKFGKQFNETYIGKDEIRGIPVNHWRSCQQWDTMKTNFSLDYYFTSPIYNTASGYKELPVRAVLNGIANNVDSNGNEISGNHTFSHLYDFVFFRPGPIKDQSLFQIPRGIICSDKKPTLVMPSLPNQFSVNLEIDTPYIDKPTTERIYFDYDYGLIRTDTINYGQSAVESHISWIEDYNSGVEYIIDKFSGNCTVQQLSNTSFGSQHSQDGYLKMRPAEEILKYNNRTYIYQGERSWRGLNTDAWANKSSDGIIQEILFLKTFNSPAMKNEEPVLVGLYIKNNSIKSKTDFTNITPFQKQNIEQYVGEKFVHFYNYQPTHSSLDVFDISMCYEEGSKKINVIFKLYGDYSQDIEGYRSYFYTAIRTKISKLCQVTPLRIASLQILDSISKETITMLFSILDKPPISSDKNISMDDAYNNLKTNIENQSQFSVKYPHSTKIFIIDVDSISLVDEDTSLTSNLSTGVVAGVGVGMLVVGIVIGLFTMFIINKRLHQTDDSTVPYTRSKD